jgi:DNA polymerase III alpha subunit (gram-positive type)
MNDLIYLDTETTGLDPDKHEVWEIAWAVNDGPIETHVLPHNIAMADPKALEMNGYWDRSPLWFEPRPGHAHDLDIRTLLKGNTLVCANPTFDRMMLRKRWGYEPYHYRSIDVESMALLLFGYERPKGFADIAENLVRLGYPMPVPDHSAGKDVEVLREVYKALRMEQKKLSDAYRKLVY